jgi:hypothetical protein
MNTDKFAILAPVPEEYLLDGEEVCRREGKVAFGSNAWELFREVDRLRNGDPVEVLIYASHHARHIAHHEASWRGTYLGHVESKGGAHPEGLRYRPPSTARHRSDNVGHWALFWELCDLRPLPAKEHLRISALVSHHTGKSYAPAFLPEGPVLVRLPWGR